MARNRRRPRGGQGKDNGKGRRVNYDNTRVDKYEKDEANSKDMSYKKTRACNDVSWYAHSPEMLKSAASLPFSYTTGMPMDFNVRDGIPGVFASYYTPTIGPRNGNFDPINQAANSLYSFVVHANSRNQSYDAPDLMMLILAGAQLFSFIGLGIRAYGVMRLYDQRNRYLPHALVRAMGFDPDDLRDNLSKMWFDLNEIIARSDQIWIPNTIPVIERWFWMNSNIYMDGDSVKSQYYLFSPSKVYKYDETAYSTGGALVDAGWNGSSTAHTWASYMSIVNGMFDALLNSQDRGIIFGDILKAFGADKIYRLSEIPSDYTVVPMYDTEVLTQIENSTSAAVTQGDIAIDSTNRIGTVANNVDREPSLSTGNFLPSKCVLNFHTKDIPTPEQIMVATRLQAIGSLCVGGTSGNADWNCYPSAVGTEYIYKCSLWYYASNGSIASETFRSTRNVGGSPEILATDKWVAFDWAPWKYRYDTAPTAANVLTDLPDRAVGDYDQFTIIDRETIMKMHIAAVYSEFGVPTMM